jgi:hypothetical protein
MMVDAYSDLTSPDGAGHESIGWRCVNCGEHVDPLILSNRWARQGISPLPLQMSRERSATGSFLAYSDPSAARCGMTCNHELSRQPEPEVFWSLKAYRPPTTASPWLSWISLTV